MITAIRNFFKARVQKGSWVWDLLLKARTGLEWLQRLKWRLLLMTLQMRKIDRLSSFEAKWFSQNGEDGILLALFRRIGTGPRFVVEFGVEDGRECNTRYLRERRGWKGLLMDPAPNNPPFIQKELVTAENINALFEKYAVPADLDLLSIDVDGNDYWIWKALEPRYRPRVVVMEYNAKVPMTESKTIAYDPAFRWDGSDYFGASLLALTRLAQSKGYTLVGCESRGANAFFVRNDLVSAHFEPHPLEELYKPPSYGLPRDGYGWPAGQKALINV